MFKLDINTDDLVRKLKALERAPVQEPVKNAQRWRRTMEHGIERHFLRMAPGGVTDSSALGESVHWPSARSQLTEKTRMKIGMPPGAPFLMAGGGMMAAFTKDATMNVLPGQRSTSLRYFSTNPQENRKAQKHQTGGPHEAVFGAIGVRKPNFPFPQRQFLYWDEQMKDELVGFLVNSIVEAMRS